MKYWSFELEFCGHRWNLPTGKRYDSDKIGGVKAWFSARNYSTKMTDSKTFTFVPKTGCCVCGQESHIVS